MRKVKPKILPRATRDVEFPRLWVWHCREGEGGDGGRKVIEGESLGETRAEKRC